MDHPGRVLKSAPRGGAVVETWRLAPLALSLIVLCFACGESKATPALSGVTATTERGRKDRDAKQALLDLEFFSEGRGLMMVPELIGVYDKLSTNPVGHHYINEVSRDRWGLVINDDDVPSGLFHKSYEDFELAVLGCATCHSGRAAGVFIPGLGNKNIDVFQIGRDAHWIQQTYTKLKLKRNNSPKYQEAQQFALDFAKTIDVERLSNLTQGVVPVSIIQTWFFKQAGVPYPAKMNRGATKVPALWGYGTKSLTGRYSDGFGHGPAWLVSIELTAGQKHETVRKYLAKVEDAERIFADLLPPEYPFAKQCAAAMPGKQTFEDRCSVCHGTYEKDADGHPVYQQPKFVPIKVVKTDPDRTEAITPEFEALVDVNPLHDVMDHNELGPGYIAPRLEGIWSRFPYLHNASVPSLRAMLTNPADRPTLFGLKDAGEEKRFDRTTVGLTVPAKGTVDYAKLKADLALKPRAVYDTRRVGQSNQGHPFGTNLAESDKQALLEYLKCL